MDEGGFDNMHLAHAPEEKDKTSELRRLSDNKEFQSLLPEYVEYWNNRPVAEEPYLHGTGSHALKRILEEGIKPRANESGVTGEAAVLSLGPKDFISLASSGRDGEMIATTYAYASCAETGLLFNADEHFPKDRVERTLEAIGGKDAFIERVLESDVRDYGVTDIEEKKKSLEIETDIMFEHALRYGAYVFKPEDARQSIDALEKIKNGEISDIDSVHRTLFINGILQGKSENFIKDRLSELDSEDCLIKKQIDIVKTRLRERIVSYEELPAEERNEIENQFPVVIMLEGKRNSIEDPGVPLLQERVSKESIQASAIREIRVPTKNVSTVEKWLGKNNLDDIVVTPLEFYEIHEVVENSKQ